MAKDIVINYSSGEILEPKKNLTLGERFFSGGNPLPEDPTKPINPWAPKPIGPVLPNKMMAAKGGLARRKHVVGLAVPIYTGLAALTGITMTAAKNYLDKNPEIYNKLAQNFDGNMEKLKENISRYIPAIHGGEGPMDPPETESFPDQSEDWSKSFGTGEGTKIPEPEKQKPPVSGDIILPPQLGGSEIPETKKEDIIFTLGTTNDKEVKKLKVKEILEEEPDISQKEIAKRLKILPSSVNVYIKELEKETPISKEEIKETFDKSKILYDQKKMTEVVELTNKEFAQKVADFVDLKHNGRLEPAVKDILGVTEKTKDVENLRRRINSLWTNRGIERDVRKGNIAPVSGLDIPEGDTTWSQTTTNISKDKSYIKNKVKPLIKEGKIDKGNYYSLRALEQIFGIQHKGTDLQKKTQRNNMGWILTKEWKDGTLRRKKDGKYPSFHLGDVMKILENRYGGGAKKIAGVVKKGTAEKYAKTIAFDKEVQNEISGIQGKLADFVKHSGLGTVDETGKEIVVDKATPDVQHAESRDNMLKYPNVFKGSNLETFQTFTIGHPGVNRDIMVKKGFESKKKTIYKKLNQYMGKKMTPEIQEEIIKLNDELGKIYEDVFEEIEIKKKDPEVGASYIGAEKTVVPVKIFIPQIGQKLKGSHVYGDMSNVEEIMGDIQDINPYAKTFNDLNQEEKDLWRKNVIEQYVDHLTDFYKNADYDEDSIETFLDLIYEGDPAGQTIPLTQRANKAIGGPVVPSVPYRENFDEGSKSPNEILEAIKKEAFELENNWNTEKNWWENLADVVDVRNVPYYADRAMRGVANVAEVSAKLPFVAGELISDLIRKPGFKRVEREKSDDEMSELFMQQTGQDYRLKPTEVWGKAWDNLMPGTFSEKLGLDSLISDEELRMQEQGMSKWPQIAGSNIELGVDVTLPWGYIGAARKAKQLEKVIGKYIVPGANVDKKVNDLLTDKGMGRRDFMKMAGTLGIIGTLKALGLDKLLKGVSRNPIPGPIKMVERSTTKMPLWFPKFIDKVNEKMTYKGDGMWDFTGTDDFLPGFHIERVGDDYYISGKNQYEQDFQITYESPKWEGDADGSYYNSGEFIVEDSVPVGRNPEDVDFDGEVVEELHDVLGGTKGMEEIAKGEKIDELTKGENAVIEAEVRADQAYDQWRESDDFIEE